MNRKIFLIGTDHKYQHNSPLYKEVSCNSMASFKKYIFEIIDKNGIHGIGEEMHRSDLKEDRNKSTLKEVALKLGIPHKYCNSDAQEALKLGHKPYLYKKPSESDEDFYKRDFENERKREPGWIQKILEFNNWPLLFVCGSEHVESFKKLLSKNSIKVVIVDKNWKCLEDINL